VAASSSTPSHGSCYQMHPSPRTPHGHKGYAAGDGDAEGAAAGRQLRQGRAAGQLGASRSSSGAGGGGAGRGRALRMGGQEVGRTCSRCSGCLPLYAADTPQPGGCCIAQQTIKMLCYMRELKRKLPSELAPSSTAAAATTEVGRCGRQCGVVQVVPWQVLEWTRPAGCWLQALEGRLLCAPCCHMLLCAGAGCVP
jgi:hypothetical protein